MNSERFKRANERANPQHKAFVSKNLDVIEQVLHLLDQKGWTQKTLAQKLGKSESEISKWLSGLHNFTFQTIVKLEQVLGSPILVTPIKHRQTVVKEVQSKLVDELIKLVSSSFQLRNQVLTHREVTLQHWCHASPVFSKTTLNRRIVRKKSEELKNLEYSPTAA
ncbi:helix-turn-helix domain-containing protein [Mucilaginibacter sp. McL0603]|uniref:helix-turn-helix domain-containing protein n=1 Tax=Mucilaginibacter sp. McL0603 TaxID=3415670 RepID=UPI003CF05AFF